MSGRGSEQGPESERIEIRERERYRYGFKGCFRRIPPLVCLVIVLLMAGLTGCSSPLQIMQGKLGGTAASPTELIVSLGFPGQHVIVDNGNDFVWQQVAIRLNDDYQYQTPLLPRGASSIPLSAFHDAEGHEFVPSAMTPHRLVIEVQSGFQGKPGYFKW